MRGSIAKSLLLALVFASIPIFTYSTIAAGPQTPSCGNYKVAANEVIAGVKFPKGSYQINSFGISCTKVMGSKGLFAQFLKLKDKDPLPKPWRYLADAIGAPKFSSAPGVGFRVQLITPTPTPTPTLISTLTPTPSPQNNLFVPWSPQFETLVMTQTALDATSAYFGKVIPSNDYEITIDTDLSTSDRSWITSILDYANGSFTNIQREKIRVFLGTTHSWSLKTLRAANLWVGDPRGQFPCSQGINDAYCAERNLVLLIYSDIYAPNSKYQWDFGRRSTPAHEVFHTVQFALAGPNIGGDSPMHIPRWLMEGSANYFGFYVADRLGFDRYQTGRNQQVNSNPAYRSVVPLVEYDSFNSDPYGIGQAATEYLVASVGFEKFLNIWKFTKTENSFSVGFKKAIGIEIGDFYSKFEVARSSMRIGP